MKLTAEILEASRLQFITHFTDRYSYLDSAMMALEGGCRWIQLRMKDAEEDEIIRTASRLLPECREVRAGGLAFVWIRYTDPEGIWKPTEKHTVKVTVRNGELLGLGSASAYVEGGYCGTTVKTYYGEAMAVIRAGSEGTVEITASDGALRQTVVLPVCGRAED